jgi:hypothetical protein
MGIFVPIVSFSFSFSFFGNLRSYSFRGNIVRGLSASTSYFIFSPPMHTIETRLGDERMLRTLRSKNRSPLKFKHHAPTAADTHAPRTRDPSHISTGIDDISADGPTNRVS